MSLFNPSIAYPSEEFIRLPLYVSLAYALPYDCFYNDDLFDSSVAGTSFEK